ncbi:GNAT family N-acetyltransferase [Streptomyces sp. 2A115]|uniref:GNAT family N-acetyltransferase n=1 Tax=Streptomyces sp. 2A115 TaxID=3457439 RepID=UPI003FD13192
MSRPLEHPLDNPARASLTGPHQDRFAERRGRVLRYPEDVSPFVAMPDAPGAADWADLAMLAGPGATVWLPATTVTAPDDWEVNWRLEGIQMVLADDTADADDAADDTVGPIPDSEAVRLGAADVPEMLALVERTQPGPIRPRTVELGTYLGIRRGGRLVAMAGERMRPPGWTEISLVCTDVAHRGQGLGAQLILAVAAGIRDRGDRPFLHAVADNAKAIRLYESLGFRLRRRTTFSMVRVPLERATAGEWENPGPERTSAQWSPRAARPDLSPSG